VLPVWLLLAPRDYLSTFMKLGTIFALAVGIFLVLPDLKMPAVTKFVDGSGLVVAGKLFPFCFITIACGAISGFHTLIASGTTPKIITRESYARPIGYGAMCLESLVAIMAIVAACTMDPGVYLAMNVLQSRGRTLARHLVSLRPDVRSVVHSHNSGRRNTRRALSVTGRTRSSLATAR
jgi:carbon starvation protein